MADPLGDSVPLTGDPRIDVVTQGGSWGFGGDPRVITYSFNLAPGGAAWSDAAKNAVVQALATFSAVANITFVEVASGGGINGSTADLAFGLTTGELAQYGAVGMAGFPDAEDGDLTLEVVNFIFGTSYTRDTYANPEGDVFIETQYPGFAYLQPGGDGLLTILHEIGHALGLKHPFDDGGNGRPTATQLGVPQYDDGLQTIMSYDFVSPYYDTGNQATPMPLDILALQQIYGANMTYHAGDDVYILMDDGVVRTIWDAGGIDTINAAGYGSDGSGYGATIDLAEAGVSTFRDSDSDGVETKVLIAFNVTIENAIGSPFADHIAGNESTNELRGNDGNDYLDGRGGADTLVGGNGDDSYAVDTPLDVIVEVANGGTDLVTSPFSYELAAALEKLDLIGAEAISGIGNAADNVIRGNSAANLLVGKSGNDTLWGSTGADTLEGGIGDDEYFVDEFDSVVELSGEGSDAVYASVSYKLAANLENLVLLPLTLEFLSGYGNELSNTITGDSRKNLLVGYGGDDRLNGQDGADTLEGNEGNDTLDSGGIDNSIDSLSGGLGDDHYIIYQVFDVVQESSDEGVDTVHTLVDFTLPDNVERLYSISTGGIKGTGNDLDNEIIGLNRAGDRLYGLGGNDTLDAGSMFGGVGDDVYIVRSTKDVITESPGEGIDTVKAFLSYSIADALGVENIELQGNARIDATGNFLANVLEGNAVENVLDGGGGADTMKGGAGSDTYVVDDAGDEIVEAADGGEDTVRSTISFVLDADLERLTLLGSADIDGTGNAGRNSLVGNAGNNRLDGGAGADVMTGGIGDDTYLVDNAGDFVLERQGQGTDTVISSVSYKLAETFEILLLTGVAAIDGFGNSADDIIRGNSAANKLSGGGGNDTLYGEEGADTLVGEQGDDTYVLDQHDTIVEAAKGGTDTVLSQISYTLGLNLENLKLQGSGDNAATGNSLNNHLVGNSGANTLDGKTGADNLAGGDGDDTYIVDNAKDVVDESGGGIDTVLSAVTYLLADGLEILELTGSKAINGAGNASDNLLAGNKGANKLDGGGGADTMQGNGGNDTYVVDDAGDQVIEIDKGGTDLVLSAVSFDLSLAGRAQIENLTFTGDGDIDATGNGLANTLTGNAGDNVLDGRGGADKMAGGLGDDTYVIDLKTDKVTEGKDAGTDTVQSVFSYVLGANLENLELRPGAGDIDGTGNTADNRLTGNEGNNRLDGKGGNDTMLGGLGDDTYVIDKAGDVADETGGGGVDTIVTPFATILGAEFENLTLTGSAAVAGTGNANDNVILGNGGANVLSGEGGDDSLSGNSGNDTLTGGAGSDTLDGGAGADSLTGGEGDDLYRIDNAKDVVVELAGGGTDTVESRIAYTLGDEVENLTLTGTAAIKGTGNALDNLIVGNTAANILAGGAGGDTLDGGKGADKLTGGAGSDTFLRHSLAEGKDTITDFETGPGGDILDISDILVGYVDGVSDAADFVQCVTAGGNTTVKVDADGAANGSKYTDVCVLAGVTASLGDLLGMGNIELQS